MSKKKKVKQFVPFFYEIKVINKIVCSVAMTSFATDGEELNEVVESLRKAFPKPAYHVLTQLCKSVTDPIDYLNLAFGDNK